MNKKFLLTGMAALMLCALTACGGDASSPADRVPPPADQTSAPATDAAPAGTTAEPDVTAASLDGTDAPAASGISYDFVLNGVAIPVGAESDQILQALGTPDSDPFEAPSCAFTGTSYYYTYSGIQIVTYPDEHDQSQNRIYEIDLKNTGDASNEGVKVGGTYDDIVAAYGTPHKESAAYAMYQDGTKAVQFFLEGNTITQIVYTIVL